MKFKVGDHVKVIGMHWPEQIGLTGTISIIDSRNVLPIQISYDEIHIKYGPTNSYYEVDLELSIIGKSPLYQALA